MLAKYGVLRWTSVAYWHKLYDFFPTTDLQWKALSHQRQKFPLKRCKADGATGRLIIVRGNAQTHTVTYKNVEESKTRLTSFCNLSLNADLWLYF